MDPKYRLMKILAVSAILVGSLTWVALLWAATKWVESIWARIWVSLGGFFVYNMWKSYLKVDWTNPYGSGKEKP